MQLSRDDIGPLDISMITNEMTEPDLPSIVILLYTVSKVMQIAESSQKSMDALREDNIERGPNFIHHHSSA